MRPGFGGHWIFDRLYWTIARATDQAPLALFHNSHHGCTFLVPREGANLRLDSVPYPRLLPSAPARAVVTTSDDWPFLYVRPGVFPWGYIVVLGTLLVLAVLAIPMAFGRAALSTGFDPILFLLGVGFLLIETPGVTALSLLFGSTWVVNAAVFGGILPMAVLANELVARLKPARPRPWFFGLLASGLLLWAVPPSALTGLGVLARGVVGGLINGLPVAFAGVIVSMLLVRSPNAAASPPGPATAMAGTW